MTDDLTMALWIRKNDNPAGFKRCVMAEREGDQPPSPWLAQIWSSCKWSTVVFHFSTAPFRWVCTPNFPSNFPVGTLIPRQGSISIQDSVNSSGQIHRGGEKIIEFSSASGIIWEWYILYLYIYISIYIYIYIIYIYISNIYIIYII